MRLSDHFTLDELTRSATAVRLGIDNTPPEAAIARLQALCVQVLEPIRAHFGLVIVDSGYRCAELNKAVRGSVASQHLQGEAADIVIPGVSALDVCRWIRDRSGITYDQLIQEGRWTHISLAARANRHSVLTARFGAGGVAYEKGLHA